ncbi:MAG TPA: hemerythrin domain-containing protein [Acidimicrobiales bacterium]|nr:hemerythrin domain-containing protein [Acidimicrobiales bacterium]
MSSAQPIDVRDMAIVHQTFRKGYAEAAGLVRAAAAPSPARVTFLADHVDFGLAMLHFHHEGEDELLYPKLIERAPEKAAVTEQTKLQHDEIGKAIDVVSAACKAWRQRPAPDTGEALASALERLNVVVQPHLDDEEQKVVPLAAVTLTKKEWDAIGEHAVAQIPRDKKGVAFGMILEPLEPADRAYMMRFLPAPVRLLYPVLIGRAWKKYAATLRTGT